MDPKDYVSAYGDIEFVKGKGEETYPSFIPKGLPPGITFDASLALALSRADAKLGKLSGAGLLLLNPNLLITPYLKKEAILSSKIEGTRISLSDLLLNEAKGGEKDVPDALEVGNYVEAVSFALKEIEQRPIDLDLIREMHRRLMKGVRGGDKSPGEFRNIQNWIGPEKSTKEEATFIPPYPAKVEELMNGLIGYINSSDDTPPLIKCSLIHYQFETIHPFRDGNGRIGRALITLYLCKNKLMIKPLLYLSGFFEENRDEYAGLLLKTNKEGIFEPWIKYFLKGVETQSADALERTIKLQELRENYRKTLQKKHNTTKLLDLIDRLFENPYITITQAKERLQVSFPTAKRLIETLNSYGITREISTEYKSRIYVAEEIRRAIDL